jgi:hypothetical protein
VSPENPWAGQGAVLLDIGGDVGALVVEMPASLRGVEVEARLDGESAEQPTHHPHVAVVDRPVGTGVVPSLVFPSLTAGRYRLARKGNDDFELSVVVSGGEVTSARWPGVTPAGDGAAPSAVPGEDG